MEPSRAPLSVGLAAGGFGRGSGGCVVGGGGGAVGVVPVDINTIVTAHNEKH